MSVLAEQQGLTDKHISGLSEKPAGLFSEQEIAALDLAEAIFSANAWEVGTDEVLHQRLKSNFTDGELLELIWAIGQFIGLGKMIAFIGLERDTV